MARAGSDGDQRPRHPARPEPPRTQPERGSSERQHHRAIGDETEDVELAARTREEERCDAAAEWRAGDVAHHQEDHRDGAQTEEDVEPSDRDHLVAPGDEPRDRSGGVVVERWLDRLRLGEGVRWGFRHRGASLVGCGNAYITRRQRARRGECAVTAEQGRNTILGDGEHVRRMSDLVDRPVDGPVHVMSADQRHQHERNHGQRPTDGVIDPYARTKPGNRQRAPHGASVAEELQRLRRNCGR